ncbi:hypothetical protein LO80_08925 [Candidatus Francisella endociliophora]|uniref:Large ribosomal RNA subunit accumulation protein YceD n=1 Tax=Candidatus Francisella endociliophora TaxID=653937 RepID=A0A097ER81_9GAMM|nr:YceD family protein [Francisella sp. FSC1006]AIT10080.1 hypothetical protein LO80_08925 [Francisella sp. FSC1006]
MKSNYYKINYSIYAKQKRELYNFEIVLEDLTKISEFIQDTPHVLLCDFSFFEEKGRPCIKYHIKGNLKLTCQDSLEVFDYVLDTSNSIVIAEDDRLVEDSLHEPFICKESIIDLRDIVKEEIILDLPLAPKKDAKTCKKVKKHSYYSEQENVIEEKKNPFEILKTLK